MEDPLAADMFSESLLDLTDVVRKYEICPFLVSGEWDMRRLGYKSVHHGQHSYNFVFSFCLDAAVHTSTPIKSKSPILGGTARRFVRRLSYKLSAKVQSQDLDDFKNEVLKSQDPEETFFENPKNCTPGDLSQDLKKTCHVDNLSEEIQSRDLHNIKDEAVMSQDPDETWFEPLKNITPDDLQSEGPNNAVQTCSEKRSSTIGDINLDDFSFPSDRSDELLTSYDR